MGNQNFEADQQRVRVQEVDYLNQEEQQAEYQARPINYLDPRIRIIAQAVVSFSRRYQVSLFSCLIDAVKFLDIQNFTHQDVENHLLEVKKKTKKNFEDLNKKMFILLDRILKSDWTEPEKPKDLSLSRPVLFKKEKKCDSSKFFKRSNQIASVRNQSNRRIF